MLVKTTSSPLLLLVLLGFHSEVSGALIASSNSASTSNMAAATVEPMCQPGKVLGSFLVVLNSGTGGAASAAAAAAGLSRFAAEITAVRPVTDDGQVLVIKTNISPPPGMVGVASVTDPEAANQAVLDILAAAPGVKYAENVACYSAALIPKVPNDPGFAQQWGLKTVFAPETWASNIGSPLTVGVMDTGIDAGHPDLALSNLRYNAVANNRFPVDDFGHGTHVAGIVGAIGNNGVGISGVNQRARIVACKWLDATGHGTTDLQLACLRYMRKFNVRIVNHSYGGGGYSRAVADELAASCGDGMLHVMAAGNGLNFAGIQIPGSDLSASPFYPASYNVSCSIVVSNLDDANQQALALSSNYGATVSHLAAPGTHIYSTVPFSSYANLTGTSMATPMVAGGAALLLAASGGTASAAQLKDWIVRGVTKVSALQGKVITGGVLNLQQSLKLVVPACRSGRRCGSLPGQPARTIAPSFTCRAKLSVFPAGTASITSWPQPLNGTLKTACFGLPRLPGGGGQSVVSLTLDCTCTTSSSAVCGMAVAGVRATLYEDGVYSGNSFTLQYTAENLNWGSPFVGQALSLPPSSFPTATATATSTQPGFLSTASSLRLCVGS